jgi:heat shock protein HslJ
MRITGVAQPFIAALVALALGACGGSGSEPGGSEPGGSSSTYDGTWTLVEGRGPDGEISVIDGYPVTLTVEGELIGGTAACNGYNGEATIDGTSFKVPGFSMTEMGCRRDVMDAEAAYVSALSAANTIGREQDVLTLSGDETEMTFELEPPIPTADLVGTRWELESLIIGTGGDGIATSVEPAYLLLKKDGTIEGTTGCRELYGEWTEAGNEIAFTTFGAKGGCPDALKEQDGQVVTVLGDGFTVEIEENRLSVTSQGDLGLDYRAAD